MDKAEFTDRITGLLPGYAPAAMEEWHYFASVMESDEVCTAAEIYEDLYIEFSLVCKEYSAELATELFGISNITGLNPFEIRGASNYLHDGASLFDVAKLAEEGLCTRTKEHGDEYRAALLAFRQEQSKALAKKPSIIAQLKDFFGRGTKPDASSPERKKSDPEL